MPANQSQEIHQRKAEELLNPPYTGEVSDEVIALRAIGHALLAVAGRLGALEPMQ
jgi:hypothetical protein